MRFSRSIIYLARDIGSETKLSVLHCVSNYPTSIKDAAINRINYLKSIVAPVSNLVSVGYSDHTAKAAAILAAVCCGAEVIELHFDLDDKEGAETMHGHCWTPKMLEPLMKAINEMIESYSGEFKIF